jgi:hypothetical protein
MNKHSIAPSCPICGNYPVRDGYRVCASCVEARLHAPHYWLNEPPDKLEDEKQPTPDAGASEQEASE